MGHETTAAWTRFLLPRLAFCALAAGILLFTFGFRPWFFSAGTSSPPPPSSKAAESDTTHSWPYLRGPNGDALSAETGLAEAWPSDGPPVLWSREIGQGYSGIIVVGDRAYTQTQRLYGQYVVALDAETGDTVWEYRYGWPYQDRMYPGPRATPTWCDGKVYYCGPSGIVGCLDADTG